MRRFRFPAAIAGLLVFLAGCADDAELDTFKPAGPDAKAIDDFMKPIWVICLIVFVLILGLTMAVWYKFRVKEYSEDDEWPVQVHGNTKLEIFWTGIPIVVMAVVSILTLFLLSDLNSSSANALAVDYEVDGVTESVEWEPHVVVVGQQWWWEYRYYLQPESIAALEEHIENSTTNPANDLPPAEIVTSTQMAIPVNQEIELSVMSRDVIHSFWIPALNGKRDALPGRVNPWKIEAFEPGIYFGQCTEYCGLSHSRMRMQVQSMTEANFEAWLTRQISNAPIPAGAEEWVAASRVDAQAALDAEAAGEDAPAPTADVAPSDTAEQRGLVAFVGNCASCHLVNGVNDIGYGEVAQISGAAPNLTHLASRTTFAGGILPLYSDAEEADEDLNGNGVTGELLWNQNDLEAWIRNPAAIKANFADGQRGMPALGLDDETIDDLVAYLATLGEQPTAQAVVDSLVD